jgi:ubiquinone/menaquinone biosynthesis C-methylase UbiE
MVNGHNQGHVHQWLNHLPTTAQYLGVDSSSTMVELTRKRLARFDSRAEVLQTDGSLTFTLPDESFDRFVSNYVLDLLSPDDIH